MNREGSERPVSEHGGRDVPGLVRDIRRLGRRLLSPEAVNDPQVQVALHQLDVQLGGLIGASRGRHRLRTDDADEGHLLGLVADAAGYNLKPDPLMAKTSVELVRALRAYRAWAGNVPYRQMADRAHHAVAYSTMYVALNSSDLPALNVVVAIIVGCGGSRADQEKFATSWRQINAGTLGGSVVG